MMKLDTIYECVNDVAGAKLINIANEVGPVDSVRLMFDNGVSVVIGRHALNSERALAASLAAAIAFDTMRRTLPDTTRFYEALNLVRILREETQSLSVFGRCTRLLDGTHE